MHSTPQYSRSAMMHLVAFRHQPENLFSMPMHSPLCRGQLKDLARVVCEVWNVRYRGRPLAGRRFLDAGILMPLTLSQQLQYERFFRDGTVSVLTSSYSTVGGEDGSLCKDLGGPGSVASQASTREGHSAQGKGGFVSMGYRLDLSELGEQLTLLEQTMVCSPQPSP